MPSSTVDEEKQWDESCAQLGQFFVDHGTWPTPRTDANLHFWLSNQRHLRKLNKLSEDRIQKLNDIDFVWEVQRRQWEARNPKDESDDSEPQQPVEVVTKSPRYVSAAQAQLYQQQWDAKYERLVKYLKEKGGTWPTRCEGSDTSLYRWVYRQRELYRSQKLNEQRKRKLEELGIDWSFKRQALETMGTTEQETAGSGSATTGTETQGNTEAAPKMAPKSKSPGLLTQRWEAMYEKLAQHLLDNGGRWPNSTHGGALHFWVKRQKETYRNKKLSDYRRDKLDDLGIDWSLPTRTIFKKASTILKNASAGDSEETGEKSPATAPLDDSTSRPVSLDGPESASATGILPDFPGSKEETTRGASERETQQWDASYHRLSEHLKENEGTWPTQGKGSDGTLYRWVWRQKKRNRDNKLSDDRKQKLDDLGIDWTVKNRTSASMDEASFESEQKMPAEGAPNETTSPAASFNGPLDSSASTVSPDHRDEQESSFETDPRGEEEASRILLCLHQSGARFIEGPAESSDQGPSKRLKTDKTSSPSGPVLPCVTTDAEDRVVAKSNGVTVAVAVSDAGGDAVAKTAGIAGSGAANGAEGCSVAKMDGAIVSSAANESPGEPRPGGEGGDLEGDSGSAQTWHGRDTWWQVDLTDWVAWGATPLVNRCMRNYGWTLESALRVLLGYRQFIELKIALQDWDGTQLAPSILVNQMWQQHVLDSCNYQNDCHFLCGHDIPYHPDGDMDTATLAERIKTTKVALKARFAHLLDESVWSYELPEAQTDTKPGHGQKQPTKGDATEPLVSNGASASDRVKVWVRNQVAIEKCYKIKRSMRFRKLFDSYAALVGLDKTALEFFYKGKQIDENATPEKLEMGGEDQIDAIIVIY